MAKTTHPVMLLTRLYLRVIIFETQMLFNPQNYQIPRTYTNFIFFDAPVHNLKYDNKVGRGTE